MSCTCVLHVLSVSGEALGVAGQCELEMRLTGKVIIKQDFLGVLILRIDF